MPATKATATHRVTIHVDMLAQVDVAAQDNTSLEELEKLAEAEIERSCSSLRGNVANIKALELGVDGWRGNDLLVAKLDPGTGEEVDNPDPYPEHYRRTKNRAGETVWVINERSPRARMRESKNDGRS